MSGELCPRCDRTGLDCICNSPSVRALRSALECQIKRYADLAAENAKIGNVVEQLAQEQRELRAVHNQISAALVHFDTENEQLRDRLAVSEQARIAHAREVERLRDENRTQRSDLDLYRDNERDQGVELAALRDLETEVVKLFSPNDGERPIGCVRRRFDEFVAFALKGGDDPGIFVLKGDKT